MYDFVRIAIFLVHFVFAIVLTNIAFEGKECFLKPTYYLHNNTDAVAHPRDTFILGSWVNVIMSLAVVEWINASFALYYINIPNFFDSENEENLGLHFNVIVCTVWNFLLIVIMWMKYSSLNIPANNHALFVFLILGAIAVQNFMARAPEKAKYDKLAYNDKSLDTNKLQFQTFNLIPMLSSNSHLSARHHLVFHAKTYAYQLDQDNRGYVCRMCAGALTTPLFYMVMLSLVPGTFTWVVQIAFTTQILLNFNIILQEISVTADSKPFYPLQTLYMITSAFLFLLIIFLFWVPNASLLFTGTSPIPVYARVLTFLLVLIWIAAVTFRYFSWSHVVRHDVLDVGRLAFVLIFFGVIAANICEVC